MEKLNFIFYRYIKRREVNILFALIEEEPNHSQELGRKLQNLARSKKSRFWRLVALFFRGNAYDAGERMKDTLRQLTMRSSTMDFWKAYMSVAHKQYKQ